MTTLERATRDEAPVDRFLTVADVANLLRVNAGTVRLHAEELGGFRVGRQWRFPLSEIRGGPPPVNGRGPHPTTGRLR